MYVFTRVKTTLRRGGRLIRQHSRRGGYWRQNRAETSVRVREHRGRHRQCGGGEKQAREGIFGVGEGSGVGPSLSQPRQDSHSAGSRLFTHLCLLLFNKTDELNVLTCEEKEKEKFKIKKYVVLSGRP